jgi:adenosine 3'-phospho 5'-phosphosulfate transporter B2
MQERVMTQTYGGDQFTNSQFLVFINRILALVVAGLYICVSPQPRHRAPFYKYSFSSISNTLSSWCQYEALKFVSFPTQVLAKASKVIPVMLMGKVVSNRTYPWHEYFTAALLSFGVGTFLLATNSSADEEHTTETTFAGIIILVGYMAFDSFTSNWQSEVFKSYRVSSIQMMFGTNLFSCVLTMGSLLFRGALFSSLIFLFSHVEFAVHALILSICSAVGQLFIFHTIATFGPVIFTLIMTTRQAISILLSCLVYGHLLTPQAMLGVLVVFLALFLRVYLKKAKK